MQACSSRQCPQCSANSTVRRRSWHILFPSFDWDDIGSWRAVANYFKNDEQGNAANCAVTAVDSTNNVIFDEGGTAIALLGVHNFIVVRTRDAILVCHRHQAEKIKNLIGKLPPELQ